MTNSPEAPSSNPPEPSRDWEYAVGRAVLYSFLSRCLLFPTPDIRRTIQSEILPLVRSLTFDSAPLENLLAEAVAVQAVDIDELRRAHGLVFTHIENGDCPAHESAYNPGDVFRRADVMADVAAFYRAHGLTASGTYHERIDHITTELEFMSFLGRKEAHAIETLGDAEIEECRRSQRHFLRDHLACWAPGLAARVQLVSEHRFYAATAALLEGWIDADCRLLDVTPAVSLFEPQPLPLPDDGLCAATGEGVPVEIGGPHR